MSMKSLAAVAVLAAASSAGAHTQQTNTSITGGPDMIRGVNLGGLFVLEPWITPSLFEQFKGSDGVIDEYTFCAFLGKTECLKQLKTHWDSWVTEDDIQTLSSGGINMLRIPIGYWLTGNIAKGEPWVDGQIPYLDKVLNWTKTYGMQAIIDVHAGPGSQNGFDNSGQFGEVHWTDEVKVGGEWTMPNIERSLAVLQDLADMYAVPDAEWAGTVVGIGILNEPRWDTDLMVLKSFYTQAYDIVHSHGITNFDFHMSDSFRFESWHNFMQYPDYEDVYLDTHIYQVFDAYLLTRTEEQHIDQTCQVDRPAILGSQLWAVVGEWSGATTDCAKWLNGYDTGSRYEGNFPGHHTVIGSCEGRNDTSTFSPKYISFLKDYYSAQMEAYEGSKGWFHWNFKSEVAPQWNYVLGLKSGWIPKTKSERTYSCPKDAYSKMTKLTSKEGITAAIREEIAARARKKTEDAEKEKAKVLKILADLKAAEADAAGLGPTPADHSGYPGGR